MKVLYTLPLLVLTAGCQSHIRSQGPVAAPTIPTVSARPRAKPTAMGVTPPTPTYPPVKIGPVTGKTSAAPHAARPVAISLPRRAAPPASPVHIQPFFNENPTATPAPLPPPDTTNFTTSPDSAWADASGGFAPSGGILCQDGTISHAATTQGACSHHGGIAGGSHRRSRRRW